MPDAYLHVTQGPLSGQSFPLVASQTYLGRDDGSDINLSDYSEVSRNHARMYYDGATLMIEDLGSTNGVFIDGQKVADARLHDGATVKMGDFVARVSLPESGGSELAPTRFNSSYPPRRYPLDRSSQNAGAVVKILGCTSLLLGIVLAYFGISYLNSARTQFEQFLGISGGSVVAVGLIGLGIVLAIIGIAMLIATQWVVEVADSNRGGVKMGTIVLLMGLASFIFLGFILGPLAWIIGNSQLRTERELIQRETTNVGRICGMIVTGAHIFYLFIALLIRP